MTEILTWIGILFCISQAAIMSGLNLALFSLGRLRLEVAAYSGDLNASKVLELRKDANFTLATILWANVSINVLLTLLADSVLLGLASFLFSTVVITLFGEIFPQAYFSRNALKMGGKLAPLLGFYKMIFWPVAKPSGLLLNRLVGKEAVPWLRENELIDLLKYQVMSAKTEVGRMEATGAVNFLLLDDLAIVEEGENLDPLSVIKLPFENGRAVFPPIKNSSKDPFLNLLASSGKKWVIVTDLEGEPRLVIDTRDFISDALFGEDVFNPFKSCHDPLIIRDLLYPLGGALSKLKVRPERIEDDVIDDDLILLWTDHTKQIITGSDILGRLMRGIAGQSNGGNRVS